MQIAANSREETDRLSFMNNNDIMRRVRYALTISNAEMTRIFKLSGHDILECEILDIVKKEKEAGYVECSDKLLELFLDGLIIMRRGERESSAPQPKTPIETHMSNNMVLKKLRIALDFKEEDMLDMFKRAECAITKPELSALFRKQGSKNYKDCGDQILRKFLHGVTVFYRPPE
jgi:uncharacterized protein YehS (DUF1456 family)